MMSLSYITQVEDSWYKCKNNEIKNGHNSNCSYSCTISTVGMPELNVGTVVILVLAMHCTSFSWYCLFLRHFILYSCIPRGKLAAQEKTCHKQYIQKE